MPSKSGCSPADLFRSSRSPRSAWPTSAVDKALSATCVVESPSSGFHRDGLTVIGLDSGQANGQCVVHQYQTHNGHCTTGNTLPALMSRDSSDGDTAAGRGGVEAESPGCFACISLCHAKDSCKPSK